MRQFNQSRATLPCFVCVWAPCKALLRCTLCTGSALIGPESLIICQGCCRHCSLTFSRCSASLAHACSLWRVMAGAGVQGAVERGAGRGGEDGRWTKRRAAGQVPQRGADCLPLLCIEVRCSCLFKRQYVYFHHQCGMGSSCFFCSLLTAVTGRCDDVWLKTCCVPLLCADRNSEGLPQRARGAVLGRLHAPGLHHAHH